MLKDVTTDMAAEDGDAIDTPGEEGEMKNTAREEGQQMKLLKRLCIICNRQCNYVKEN